MSEERFAWSALTRRGTPRKRPPNRPVSESIGERFGRLVVLEIVGRNHRGLARVRCLCDCGSAHELLLHDLRSGSTKSCGCWQRELHRESVVTHDMSYSAEYIIWQSMVRRCTDPRVEGYAKYGGRGITVCDEWMASFEAFFADMGLKPGPSYSIDRVDNNSGYFPGNVRWATKKQQARNTRSNVLIQIGDETICQVEVAERAGVSASAIRARLASGISGDALLSPARVASTHTCTACGQSGHNRRTCRQRTPTGSGNGESC